MKRTTRIIYHCLYLIMFISALLIALSYSAPNPTGRWFSSEFVDINQAGNVFGHEAEIVLSRDLPMRQNDSADGERRCFCNRDAETPPGRCNVCEVNTGDISNYHIPDFVNNRLIIDSKAVQIFRIDEQIRIFISVAHQSKRPLWIYVRHDTIYSQETLAQIQATGGDIVDYFVVDGYGYLIFFEQSLNNILIAILIFAGGVMVWQFVSLRRNDSPSNDDDDYYDNVERTEETLDETEEMLRRMERLSKREDDNQKKK